MNRAKKIQELIENLGIRNGGLWYGTPSCYPPLTPTTADMNSLSLQNSPGYSYQMTKAYKGKGRYFTDGSKTTLRPESS